MTQDPAQVNHSRLTRWLFLTAGLVALALGIVGIFLPLLPTTPFILLAAACFARSSHRFHARLLANPTFGPIVREWETHRSIPYRTKLVGIALMSVTMTISIAFFVRPLWLQVALAFVAVGLAIWLYRIPSRDRGASARF